MRAVRAKSRVRTALSVDLSGPDGADKEYEVLRASLVATPTEQLRNETYFGYFHGRQHQNPLIFTQYHYGLVAFVTQSPALAEESQP